MLIIVAILLLGQSPDTPQVRLEPADSPRAVFRCEVKGISRDNVQVFTIADPSKPVPANTPSIVGTYQIYQDKLNFRPRYPLDRGLTYRVLVSMPGKEIAEFDFRLEPLEKKAPSAVVTTVSPTSDVLPENLLKFYVAFSKPMSRGDAYKHILLSDAKGKALELPFLELAEELWDPRGQRFTLLLDPGRIKSGLLPREESGPILEAGKTYTLKIDRGWEDAEGTPLVKEFRKTFKVGPADTESPDPKRWTLELPRAGTLDPFVARFPEPLDRALLARTLGITQVGGEPPSGRIELADDQRSWTFVPEKKWRAGGYRLRVAKSLEDLAGNSVGRPFEVDLSQKRGDESEEGFVELPWETASGPS